MILVCSGLALDRFTHDSSLFSVWHVYTGF